jgi:site-specific recombinase XerD
MSRILGQDVLGAQIVTLLTTAWAPSTSATYGSTIQRYLEFCEEQQQDPLAGNPATMARFVTWLGNLGTIKASSPHPYMSAVNNFCKDHGREPTALGDLVARVRKRLATSHVTLAPTLIRVPPPSAFYTASSRALRNYVLKYNS